MDSVIIKRPGYEKMTLMQINLSNRLHTLASRTTISIAGQVEYWETYIGLLSEYRSSMKNPSTMDRCEGTIEGIKKRIYALRKKSTGVIRRSM